MHRAVTSWQSGTLCSFSDPDSDFAQNQKLKHLLHLSFNLTQAMSAQAAETASPQKRSHEEVSAPEIVEDSKR